MITTDATVPTGAYLALEAEYWADPAVAGDTAAADGLVRPDGPGTDVWLAFYGASPDALISGAITRNANGAATSAPVLWPDGSPGFTRAPHRRRSRGPWTPTRSPTWRHDPDRRPARTNSRPHNRGRHQPTYEYGELNMGILDAPPSGSQPPTPTAWPPRKLGAPRVVCCTCQPEQRPGPHMVDRRQHYRGDGFHHP